MSESPLYTLKNVAVAEKHNGLTILDIAALAIGPGKVLLQGPTGAGKSTLLTILRGLVLKSMVNVTGQALLDGKDLLAMNTGELENVRRMRIAYIPSEPAKVVGDWEKAGSMIKSFQAAGAPEKNTGAAEEITDALGLPLKIFGARYGGELSGGERQRVGLACALNRLGDVLLLDEPASSLDMDVKERLFKLLDSEVLKSRFKLMILVTHDEAQKEAFIPDRTINLESGRLLDYSDTEREQPAENPTSYRVENAAASAIREPLLFLRDVRQPVWFVSGLNVKKKEVLKNFSMVFKPGRIYGVTGVSGGGKTTLFKTIMRLVNGTQGSVVWKGRDLVTLNPMGRFRDVKAMKPVRKELAMSFQESFTSFPRYEPVNRTFHRLAKKNGGVELQGFLNETLPVFGISREHLEKEPVRLSAGELRRIDILRALYGNPELLILDEPFASLDAAMRIPIEGFIKRYVLKKNAICLISTHLRDVIEDFCDEVFTL